MRPHWGAAERWREEYEETLRLVGEEGFAIYRAWRAVAEQRSFAGALEHMPVWKYIEEAGVPRSRRFDVFEKVCFIDATYRDLARKGEGGEGEEK